MAKPSWRRKLRNAMFGAPRDPFSKDMRQHIALVAFMAWVGLGADGLSSANYGPAEAFLALGQHTHLALYLAGATALTVFVIALCYNQVIALFPGGGGGYKIASRLIHPGAGAVSGSALVIDYVLTIAISAASGIDALFSLFPMSWAPYKLTAASGTILLLIWLNMRGVKESVKVLMPIFLGFVVTHAYLIVHGIIAHADRLPSLIPDTIEKTQSLSVETSWLFVLALFFKAFSMGGGTYTGLETVSNNVSSLAEPRVRTAQWTMFYMAVSLSFTAAGIILLYLIWDVTPVAGMTLNAAVFQEIMQSWGIGGFALGPVLLPVVMFCAAGLLFVAANSGFLAGPMVLANMAADRWMPHQFSCFSSRLVAKYGIMLMGAAALAILIWTDGQVHVLVVLYSINVFLTFTLSMLGLCIYWLRHHRREPKWGRRLSLAFVGLLITSGILVVTVFEKFAEGGWKTIIITGLLIATCVVIRRHYANVSRQMSKADDLFVSRAKQPMENPPPLDPGKPTAVFFVVRNLGAGMHSLLWVLRLFPNVYKNFVFVTVGEVDAHSFGEEAALDKLKKEVNDTLSYFVNYCHHHGYASTSYQAYGTDLLDKLTELAEETVKTFPNSVFFSSKLVFEHENWFMNLLHNHTSYLMQRRLHIRGMQMVILPMKV